MQIFEGLENAEMNNTGNNDLGDDLFEGLSSGTKVGEVTREGKDATEIKEAVESIF